MLSLVVFLIGCNFYILSVVVFDWLESWKSSVSFYIRKIRLMRALNGRRGY